MSKRNRHRETTEEQQHNHIVVLFNSHHSSRGCGPSSPAKDCQRVASVTSDSPAIRTEEVSGTSQNHSIQLKNRVIQPANRFISADS